MRRPRPWVLGLSASHNGAACLLRGDELVVAVQEERLTRAKRARTWGARPSLSIGYCLEFANIEPADLSMVVIAVAGVPSSHPIQDVRLNPQLQLGLHGVPSMTVSHHLAHAVSAYACSGFRDAGVLVVDGVGSPVEDLNEDERRAVVTPVESGVESISLYVAEGARITAREKHLCEREGWFRRRERGMGDFRSLGGMFSAVADQIFGEALEAGKVMGLAPFGKPAIPAREFFAIRRGRFEFKDAVPRRFRHSDRWPLHAGAYQDLACSVQRSLERALLHLVARLRDKHGCRRLCFAGGVALNSIANERIVTETGLDEVFILPAAEDSGPAVGAAYYGLYALAGHRPCVQMTQDAAGRTYAAHEVDAAVAETPCVRARRPRDVLSRTVDLLCDGGIVGWFDGRSELGPRALGHRSILCDPRRPDAKDILNTRVKHRESFRPFAPAVLEEEVHEWFELTAGDPHSPFMLRVCRFRPDKIPLVPAVVHVDGTGRLQTLTRSSNGRFYELVRRFHERTGVPILLNTSFNVAGEPLVETPSDALWCMLSTGIDCCVFEDRIVTKAAGFRSVRELYPKIIALSWRLEAPIEAGQVDFAITSSSTARFQVRTRWGEQEHALHLDVLPLLQHIDGSTSGRAILEALRRARVPMDEETLVSKLAALRRYSVIQFAEKPSAAAGPP